MTASIRGHGGQVRVFKNGSDMGIVNMTRAEVTQDSTFSRSFYVGQQVPEGDQTIEGWSGSMDLEVKDASVDDLIDELVTNNQNGVGVADYSMVFTELYGDGQVSSHVYYDCQFKMSKTQPGLTEKVTKRLEFQSSGRLKL